MQKELCGSRAFNWLHIWKQWLRHQDFSQGVNSSIKLELVNSSDLDTLGTSCTFKRCWDISNHKSNNCQSCNTQSMWNSFSTLIYKILSISTSTYNNWDYNLCFTDKVYRSEITTLTSQFANQDHIYGPLSKCLQVLSHTLPDVPEILVIS